jgi:transposase
MYIGQLIFAQLMAHLPKHTFRRCVQKYNGDRKVKSFSCLDHFLVMAFAQLTYRESLRETVVCLRSQSEKLYHMGIRSGVSRNTLSNANKVRDWRIYADFAQALINKARPLYADEDLGLDLDNTIYALDASTIDLCLSLFPWAKFRSTKSAVKLHTLIDLRGNIPTFIDITDGKVHDVNVLDVMITEPGAFYIMDRGYLDFGRLFRIHQTGAFFVIRAKSNTQYKRRYSNPLSTEEKINGVKCDQIIVLTGVDSQHDYPEQLRRVKYYDREIDKTFNFLTNNFTVPAQNIADLYKQRWQVELFFKWIKQHLRIKSFFGTSENAVKSQVWIAVSVYVLIAIIKKERKLEIELYTILQILSLTLFEKTPLDQLFMKSDCTDEEAAMSNQLNLFD